MVCYVVVLCNAPVIAPLDTTPERPLRGPMLLPTTVHVPHARVRIGIRSTLSGVGLFPRVPRGLDYRVDP